MPKKRRLGQFLNLKGELVKKEEADVFEGGRERGRREGLIPQCTLWLFFSSLLPP